MAAIRDELLTCVPISLIEDVSSSVAVATVCTLTDASLAAAETLIFAFAEKGSPHAYWVAKAYIALGDIYAGRDDSFQARATYQSIVDGYSPADDGIVIVQNWFEEFREP